MAEMITFPDGGRSLDMTAAYKKPRKKILPKIRKIHPQNTLSFEATN